MQHTKRVLLIGAGAVGQVYGYHFQRGGAEVAFYVREKYAEDARKGFDLYPMNRKNPRSAPVRFEGFDVFTDMGEAMAQGWDAVVICLSSTALRKGTWLEELAAGLGEATLVNLTPGIKDYAYVCERVPSVQVVSGLIGFSSYPGPLPGEELPKPGMVYWVPPMTKMAFSGPKARTKAIVSTLSQGGLKSKMVADVHATTAFASPVLQFHIVAMELTGWTFKALRADKPLMTLVNKAIRQANGLAAAELGKKQPLGLKLLSPWVMRLATRFIPMVSALDMERFFEKHFLKVGDQTVFGLETRIAMARQRDLPVDAMETLKERLVAYRADAPASGGVPLAKAS